MNPREWEQACLAEVRRLLGDPGKSILVGKEIEDVRLEGSRPDTQMIVELSVWGDKRRLAYRLWGDDFAAIGAEQQSPYRVGGLIEMWVGEEQ